MQRKRQVICRMALKSVNVPVGVASYEVRNYLPTEDEINKYIQLDIEIDND